MDKYNFVAIGGVGIENKALSGGLFEQSLGGSAWSISLTARALGVTPYIVSRIGIDKCGEQLDEYMIKQNLVFEGMKYGETQIFNSVIEDGDPKRFEAVNEDLFFEQILQCMERLTVKIDAIIVGYSPYEILPFLGGRSKEQVIVVDMSGSILSIPSEFVFHYLRGFDSISLNDNECSIMASKLNIKKSKLLLMLNQFNKMVFVTSRDSIVYAYNNKINHFEFEPLQSVEDATGAGDAFATGIAYGLCKKWEVERIVNYALNLSHKMCMMKDKSFVDEGGWM